MKVNGRTLSISVAVVVVVCVILLVGAAIGRGSRIYKVAAMAMTPTLQMGDLIEVSPLTSPHRQDIVLCRWPGSTTTSLSRVIGLPGELIEIKHTQVYVNSRRLPEPYAHFGSNPDWKDYPKSRDDLGPLRVPTGHYFVLGDNRDDANDSRFRGTIPRDGIDGLITAVNH